MGRKICICSLIAAFCFNVYAAYKVTGDLQVVSGNIGVGSTSPRGRIDVDGEIYSSGTGRSLFYGGGVSIGTSSPDKADTGNDLFVQGNIEADGEIYVDGNIYPSVFNGAVDGAIPCNYAGRLGICGTIVGNVCTVCNPS